MRVIVPQYSQKFKSLFEPLSQILTIQKSENTEEELPEIFTSNQPEKS